MTTKRGKQFIVRIAAALLAAAVVAIIVYTWTDHNFRQWAMRDATELAPYSVVLVREGEKMEDLDELDRSLASTTMDGRLVVQLTRSEYRKSLFGRRAWVKTHLVTARKGGNTTHQEIKLLIKLERREKNWEISHVEELTLP